MQGSSWGGSEELWYKAALTALREGDDIDFAVKYAPSRQKINELIQNGARFISLSKPAWLVKMNYRSKRYLRKNLFTPFDFIYKNRYDKIVISQGGTFDIAIDIDMKAAILNIKDSNIFIICHSIDDNTIFLTDAQRKDIRLIFNKADRIFFVAQRSLSIAEKKIAHRINNAQIIKNPLNLRDITYVPFPEIENKLQLAMVGSLNCRWKGHDLIFEALSNLKNRLFPWILNIYGTGQDENYLKELCNYYKISENVIFHGYAENIREIWEENHTLIMSSRVESAPLSLVEAMVCGRPALVTNIGGMPEWVTDNVNGFIANSINIEEIESTVIRLFNSINKLEEMGLRAHSDVFKMVDKHPESTLLKIIAS